MHIVFTPSLRRRLRHASILLLALLALVGIGRLLQVAWDSHYGGAREPYLQMVTPTAITVRWQSGSSEVGVVRYGTAPERLEFMVREATARTGHEVRLTGLQPATRYYYSVGIEDAPFREGADYWFETAPPAGSDVPVRIWVQGDPGWWHEGSRAVRDAALAWAGQHARPGRPPFDLWLTTGDNAYTSGRNREYQAALFEPYADLLRNIPYLPVYGNHDARRWAFFDIFTFPAAGEAGGVPSGSAHYFSFDYGPIHFVVLDSQDSDRGKDGAMMEWLRQDLAAHRQPWLIALFHHPPYTRGSHDSDSPFDSGRRMIEMRERFLPVLEAAGVDLVLSGHSHVYERSHLLGCHYGASDTLDPAMILARASAGVPYGKAAGLTPHGGTVYAVVGSSAKLNNGPLDYPAMAVVRRELGSLIIDVGQGVLTARFINSAQQQTDEFQIVKGEPVARGRGPCAAQD